MKLEFSSFFSLIQNIEFDSFSKDSIYTSILNLLASSFLGYLLGIIYINYGKTISNRESLGNIFPLLSVTTMIVITVVKSSLALSLGLVGALSIVRFRTPVKEPEELVFLFCSIALGLGIGANQYLFSFFAFLAISTISILKKRSKSIRSRIGSFTMFIYFPKDSDKTLIIQKISENTNSVLLKSFNENIGNKSELVLNITLDNFKSIDNLSEALKKISAEIGIEIIDTSKIIGGV